MSSSSSGAGHWAGVLKFWFDELRPVQWFETSPELDEIIRVRFLPTLDALADEARIPPVNASSLRACGLNSDADVLAAILVLDQFSRNIYRGNAQAFSMDPLALALSSYLVDADALQAMTAVQIQFAVMPHMHAESLTAQETCVAVFSQYNIEKGLKSAIEHREIIRQFGRFPHRNTMLGRQSSSAELEYLQNANRFGQ